MKRQWIVWYAVVLHGFWVLTLLGSPLAMGCTGLAAMAPLFGHRFGVAIFLSFAVTCSLFGLLRPPRQRSLCVALLAPQQLALTISAVGAVSAIADQTFADGIHRSAWFIAPDQVHYVVAAIFHTAAMYEAGGQR